MRGIRYAIAIAVVAGSLLVPTTASAGGGVTVLDSYCSQTGDYCTVVVRKADGTIVFKIRAFGDYFGPADACVRKETRVCHTREPREAPHDTFVWAIRWQGNYPNQGAGEYTVTWRSEGGTRIGRRLHFTRG